MSEQQIEIEALRALLVQASDKRKESQKQLVAAAAAAIAAATAAGVTQTTIYRTIDSVPLASDTVALKALVKDATEQRKQGHTNMRKTAFFFVEDM